jgi:hypothetical protein
VNEVHDHEFGAWTSNENGTHSRVCSICGASETVDCTYTDVVTAPTVTDQGYTTHTCTVCGYSFADTFTDPLGYDYTVTFTVPEGVAVQNENLALSLAHLNSLKNNTNQEEKQWRKKSTKLLTA